MYCIVLVTFSFEKFMPQSVTSKSLISMEFAYGQFHGDRRTVQTHVFGVYKICCITGSYLWVFHKDITL